MDTHWIERQKIHTYEVDSSNRLKASAIFGFMQESASNSAKALGWGYDELIKEGFFWVLTRIKLKVKECKHVSEQVLIETWPKQIEGMVAHRDFRIEDSKHGVIALATSSWFLIDSSTKRPVKTEVLKKKIPHFNDDNAIDEQLNKIVEPKDKVWIYKREIHYSDIDIVQHVNNTKYVDFILDSFPLETHLDKKMSSIQINFIQELKLGDSLNISQAQSHVDARIYYIDGTNQHGKMIFQSEVIWE